MSAESRVVVRNPHSGNETRTRLARDIALDRGFEVLDSRDSDHAKRLAAEAAERADVVVACGGDGTLNDVVAGVSAAGRLDDVTLGVIPAGTGNDFADNVGVRGVDHAFDVIETGDERRLDLGVANGRPFLNSCVGGITADASAGTSSARKRRFGSFAYLMTVVWLYRNYDAPALHVSAGSGRDPVWSGDALMLLIGNGRRFPGDRNRQANMEDGMLTVVIMERLSAARYLYRGAAARLRRRGEADYLTRLCVSHLHVTHDGRPIRFSLDGSVIRTDELTAETRPGAMRFLVGPSYETNPDPVRGGSC